MKQNKYGTWAVGAFMLLLSAAACTDSYESTPVDMFTEDYLFSKTDSNGTVVRKYLNRIYYYMRNGHNGVYDLERPLFGDSPREHSVEWH